MKTIEFFYSIGSRYSYLAWTQLDALRSEADCRINWLPIDSVRFLSERPRNPFQDEPVSGQYDWVYRKQDAERWAALYGVPFVEPRGRVTFDSNRLALACTAAKRLGHVEAFTQQMFAAMFCEASTSQIDEAECVRRSVAAGLSEASFVRELRSESTTAALRAAMDHAHDLGVFGVPTFTVERNLFWGNDRLPLVRHHLKRTTAQ